MEGKKYDSGKLRWDLLPPEPIEQVVDVLTQGSIEYGDENWRLVENGKRRYAAALMRHIWEFRKGAMLDTKSGLPHLAHAITNCIFLLELYKNSATIVKGDNDDDSQIPSKGESERALLQSKSRPRKST